MEVLRVAVFPALQRGWAGRGRVGMPCVAAVDFNSVPSVWITDSMLGKHSTLLGGEVFGINRRNYHCQAIGGPHVACNIAQAAAGAPAVGCRASRSLLSSHVRETRINPHPLWTLSVLLTGKIELSSCSSLWFSHPELLPGTLDWVLPTQMR